MNLFFVFQFKICEKIVIFTKAYKMNDNDSDDEFRTKFITPQDILESCVRNQLYTIPELNETLFLHFGGFNRISSLEPYINLTSLWLNNNSIGVIEGLSSLKNLICLYLNGNVIKKIEGLDELENLETLCLSNNYIKKIENVSALKKLHTLELDHNYIEEPENIRNVVDLPALGNLNLSFNKLDSEEFLPIISNLQHLALLKLEGNPIARTMSQYRRKILYKMPTLTYLDDSPVSELDIRCARAYMEGGRDAEMEERQRYRKEKEDEKTRNRRELRRVNRKYAIEAGIDISHDKYMMSSDDERLFVSSSESNSENEDNDDNDVTNIKKAKQLSEETTESSKVNNKENNYVNEANVATSSINTAVESRLLEEESSSSDEIDSEKENEHNHRNEDSSDDDDDRIN